MFYPPPHSELEDSTDLLESVALSKTDVANLTTETVSKASLENQIAYKRRHMQQIALWVLENYSTIRKTLGSKTKNNSDLSFSVSKLLSDMSRSERNGENRELFQAVNAFKNIDGESWYPKIRFLDEATLKSRSEGDNPITIVEDATVNGQTSTGYELDENNELYQLEETPTEENTVNRSLVVIELGDTDCDGNQKCNTGGGGDNTSGDGNTGGGGNSSNMTTVRFEKMTVKDLKEAWPFRPEIHFKGFSILSIPFEDGVCGTKLFGSSSCNDALGRRVKQIDRSDKNDEFSSNYIIDDELNESVPQFVIFTIFEKDGFPAPKAESSFIFPNGVVGTFEYRSWESPYDEQILNTQNNVGNLERIINFSNENNDIKYSLD